MSLLDFFFPEQAQAAHLRTLAQRSRRNDRSRAVNAANTRKLEQRVEQLERDLGFTALLLASLKAHLEENGSIDREGLRALIDEFDLMDGEGDGQLDLNVLRGLMAQRGDG